MSKVEKYNFSEMGKLVGGGDSHPLLPFVEERLIPDDVEIVVLQDLNDFHARIVGGLGGLLSHCTGIFVAPNHCWADDAYKVVKRNLKKIYGVGIDGPTMLLSEGKYRRYWSMIHEGLHAVFHALPESSKDSIAKSAVAAYPTAEVLHNMLRITHLNISYIDWTPEINKQLGELYDGDAGYEAIIKAEKLFKLGNAVQADQRMCVDEFIANFYANKRVDNRWDEKHLAPSFKETLKNLGYNMDCPPSIEDESL